MVPTMHSLDVWLMSFRFMLRELRHHALGEQLEIQDLMAHLAWQPWVSNEQAKRYEAAIESGAIDPINVDYLSTLKNIDIAIRSTKEQMAPTMSPTAFLMTVSNAFLADYTQLPVQAGALLDGIEYPQSWRED